MNMPTVLPNITVPVSVQIPVKWRYYMNVCTVSYSAVWWDWARWQMEIDWMALNGNIYEEIYIYIYCYTK